MFSAPQLPSMAPGSSLLGCSLTGSSSLFLNSGPTQHSPPDLAARAQALHLSATLLTSTGQALSPKSVCAVAARLLTNHEDLFHQHQRQSSSDGTQRSCSLDLSSLTTTTSCGRSLDLGPGAGWPATADRHSWDSSSGGGSSSSSGSGGRPPGRAYRRSLTSPALAGSRSPEAVSGPAATGRPSLSGPAAGAAGRGRSRSVCRVDGCHLELKGTATARHRVCARHLMEPAVVLRANKPLELYRFCNLCCKFEPISCFEGTRRGCRAAREQEHRHQHHYRQAAAVAATARSKSAPDPLSSANLESLIEQAMLQELAATGLTEPSAAGAAANPARQGAVRSATAAEQEALLSNFLAPVALPPARQPAAQQPQQWQAAACGSGAPGSSGTLRQSMGDLVASGPSGSHPSGTAAMELDQPHLVAQPQHQQQQQMALQQPGSMELSFRPALLPSASQDFASCCGSAPGSFSMPLQQATPFAAADLDVLVADDPADWLESICSPSLDDSCQRQDNVLLQLQQFDWASANATIPPPPTTTTTTTYTLPDLPAATQPPHAAATAAARSCAAGGGAAAGLAFSPQPAHGRPGSLAQQQQQQAGPAVVVDTSELQTALALKLQGMQEEARRMKHMINMLKAMKQHGNTA